MMWPRLSQILLHELVSFRYGHKVHEPVAAASIRTTTRLERVVVKITYRHQEAKCVNASLKVFHLFNFSHVWFFRSLSGCS